MRLIDCDLNPSHIRMLPQTRSKPEPDWVFARDTGIIPPSLFAIYARASYLSLGSAPPYLSDKDNLLFSYFSMILRNVKESLEDADQELKLLIDNQKLAYNPDITESRSQKSFEHAWRTHFRLFILSLYASLDSCADLICILLTGEIKINGLELGRAEFSLIEKWVRQPLATETTIVSPKFQHIERLYSRLRLIIMINGPEKDWLRLMRMLRNKAAHLGFSGTALRFVILKGNDNSPYPFLPRQWPYIWEKYLRRVGEKWEEGRDIKDIMLDDLIHEDVISFAKGLQSKTKCVVEIVAGIVYSAYVAYSKYELNQAALKELKRNSREFEFEHFQE